MDSSQTNLIYPIVTRMAIYIYIIYYLIQVMSVNGDSNHSSHDLNGDSNRDPNQPH